MRGLRLTQFDLHKQHTKHWYKVATHFVSRMPRNTLVFHLKNVFFKSTFAIETSQPNNHMNAVTSQEVVNAYLHYLRERKMAGM